MSKTGVTIGGNADDLSIIQGSGNTIIQIINKVYKNDDLNELVINSFRDIADLLAFRGDTFPAVDSKSGSHEDYLQTQSPYEVIINEFKRSNEMIRLLGEIKKRNPKEYRNFLAGQVLDAIGMSTGDIPIVKTGTKIVEKEILRLQKTAISQQKTMHERTLEFEDRNELFDEIRDDRDSSHVVLHGPSGVGKTHFLNHFPNYFQERYNHDTRCVFIDLNTCEPENILAMAIKQLSGEKKPNNNYLELATVISMLFKGEPGINRFYFLFDNADQNQAAIDYLFGPDNIIDNPTLNRILKGWGILEHIQLKIILAARHPVKPSTIYHAFSSALHKKMAPLSRQSVQRILEKLMKERHIPPHLDLIEDLSDEVYYLTGGHPRCVKQMLMALAERGCVKQTEDEWVQLYKDHVIAIIYAEMLKPIDSEILSTVWNLSIFRRFDQPLLLGLLDRGLLPSLPGDKSHQARDLRTKLEEINLFDTDESTSTITTNYAMRRAISLNMQHDALDRYKTLNVIALEIFLDRLQSSKAGIEKQIERMAINLFEILYHWTKLIEIDNCEEKPQPNAGLLCAKIHEAFENYLLFALAIIRNEDRSAFFQLLGKRWKDDVELSETVRRVTRQDDCVQAIQQLLNKYNTNRNGAD